MARRQRRAPRGSDKTAVMHFRVQPLTLKAVKDAAKTSGRTVSAECEAQLQRALFGMGGGLWPILQVVSDNLNRLTELKGRAWADDPILFDRAFNAIVAMLEMCRPPGSIHRGATDNELQADRNVMYNSLIRILRSQYISPASKTEPRTTAPCQTERATRRDWRRTGASAVCCIGAQGVHNGIADHN